MSYFDVPTKVYTDFDLCVAETTLTKVLDRIAHPKDETRALIDCIRAESDTDQRKALKQQLAGFTPCVLCGERRRTDNIVSYTGFAHIDLDAKDNPNVSVTEMKERLKTLDYIAFACLSASGKGVFALPRIDPERWNDSIETISTDLRTLGLVCDSQVLSNPVSLRFITYDTDAYLTQTASVLTPRIQKSPEPVSMVRAFSDTAQKVERALLEIECERIDITQHYDNWLRIGFAFADEFGERGRAYFHAVSRNYPNYKPSETDRQYDNCLKHRPNGEKVTIGYFFHLCREYGVGISTCTANQQSASIPKRDYSKYEKYFTKPVSDDVPLTDKPLPFADETPIPITIPENLKQRYLSEADGVSVLSAMVV
jgi:hypothetical protein